MTHEFTEPVLTNEQLLALSPFSVGQMVTTLRDTRLAKLSPDAPGTIFSPGTVWKIVRVFISVWRDKRVLRYRLASHGVSVVTTPTNIRVLKS